MYVYLTCMAPSYLYFAQDNLTKFLRRFKYTISEAAIGPIAVKEIAVDALEEEVDGPLPPLVPGVASPGESGGRDALVGGEEEREVLSNKCDRYNCRLQLKQ